MITKFMKSGVSVTMEDIGEGLYGDYNRDDPADEPMLRFYVDKLVDDCWEEVDSGSYCTSLNVDKISDVQKIQVCQFIHAAVEPLIKQGLSIKKACEKFSWVTLDPQGELLWPNS